MPAVTVVAKRFTLVQAAQAAKFKPRNFILLEAFCLTPRSRANRPQSRVSADARVVKRRARNQGR